MKLGLIVPDGGMQTHGIRGRCVWDDVGERVLLGDQGS